MNSIEQEDFLTDDDIVAPRGYAGIGLLVSEDGELALTIMDGCIDRVDVFHMSEVEARALAAMIQAVLA